MSTAIFVILFFLGSLALLYSILHIRKEKGHEPKIVFITSLTGLISLFSSFYVPNNNTNFDINISKQKLDTLYFGENKDPVFPKTKRSGQADSSLMINSKYNRIRLSYNTDFEADSYGHIAVITKKINLFTKNEENIEYLIPINKIEKLCYSYKIPGYPISGLYIYYTDGTPKSYFESNLIDEDRFNYFIENKLRIFNDMFKIERFIPWAYVNLTIFALGLLTLIIRFLIRIFTF